MSSSFNPKRGLLSFAQNYLARREASLRGLRLMLAQDV